MLFSKNLVFVASLLVPVASFLQQQQRAVCFRNGMNPDMAASRNGCDDRDSDEDHSSLPITRNFDGSMATTRRDVLQKASSGLVGAASAVTACCCCCPDPALALAQITAPPADQLKEYDLPRNSFQDAAFAQGMAIGMGDYERAAYPIKRALFKSLFQDLQKTDEPVVVEIGIGSFPNAPYYTPRLEMGGVDIIGVDPNDKMEGYARDNAIRAGLKKNAGSNNNNLRVIHGVSEALPLDDNSCDAVVCSLTLCSVVNPARSVAEIKRVLKPGGKFLFWEHVLSQTDPALANQQILATPMQVVRADGCHLDRKTGDTIKNAGFASVDIEYLELKNFGYLNPTVCGIATA